MTIRRKRHGINEGRMRTEEAGLATYSQVPKFCRHIPTTSQQRVGYLWLRSHSPEALQLKTGDLVIPQGRELEGATAAIKRDAGIGGRTPRKVYERLIAKRVSDDVGAQQEEASTEFAATLTSAYLCRNLTQLEIRGISHPNSLHRSPTSFPYRSSQS